MKSDNGYFYKKRKCWYIPMFFEIKQWQALCMKTYMSLCPLKRIWGIPDGESSAKEFPASHGEVLRDDVVMQPDRSQTSGPCVRHWSQKTDVTSNVTDPRKLTSQAAFTKIKFWQKRQNYAMHIIHNLFLYSSWYTKKEIKRKLILEVHKRNYRIII
jgi:hypothetical protein